MDIDIVVPWVDGNDPEWLTVKEKYRTGNSYADRDERYREWGLLKYWFRCVEKNAPWVRMIHFITWGHIPEWLNTSDPRIHVVKHVDFLPESARPCFNSSLIERYLNRIPGLSEHFIYFNDDIYLLGKTDPDYFFKNDLPRDMLAFQPVVANPSNPLMSQLFMNNTLVLSRHFDKRKNVKDHQGSYFHIGYPPLYFIYNLFELSFPKFTGLYSAHTAVPLLKSTFDKVWAKEEEYLKALDKNKFRDNTDVNQYLFREWGKLEGSFIPTNVTRHFMYTEMSDDEKKVLNIISSSGKRAVVPDIKLLCLNDTGAVKDERKVIEDLKAAFEKGFGEKCSFEK